MPTQSTMFDQIGNGIQGLMNKKIAGGNSINQNLGQVGGFLNTVGSAVRGITGANNNQVATPYGYKAPNQVSSSYIAAGATPPSDLNKVYGQQQPYDVAKTGTSTGMMPAKTTSTPAIKSVTTTYHPPATNTSGGDTSTSSPSTTPPTPTLTPQQQFDQNQANGKDINGNPVSPPPTQNQQAVSGLLNQANQSPAYTQAQNAEQAAQAKLQATQGMYNTELAGTANVGNSQTLPDGTILPGGAPITASDQAGQAGILDKLYSQQIANAQTGVTQAQTQVQNALGEQGAQTTAGTNAASATQPIGAAPIMNPQTGQLINPGLVQQALSAVQQAVANGTDVNNDPNIRAIANSMGFLGASAVLNMMNSLGTSSTAQSAASQQNASTGQAFQSQGADLQATLTNLNGLGSQVNTIMGLTGANPFSTPIANQTYANYFKNVNPSAQASIASGLGEIKNSVSQIIASATGLTPTAVSSTLDSYDFTTLTPKQLNEFMQNVDAYGQTKLSSYQQGKNASYGSNLGYSGLLANPSAPVNGGTANSPIVAGAATGVNAVSGLFNDVMSALSANASSSIAGAAGGVATKMFGAAPAAAL